MSVALWPPVGRTVPDHNGNAIPVNGVAVSGAILTSYYLPLVHAGSLLTYDPLDGGGSPSTIYTAGAVQAVDTDTVLELFRGDYDGAQARTSGADAPAALDGGTWIWDASSEVEPGADCIAPDPAAQGRWLRDSMESQTAFLAAQLATLGGSAGKTITMSGTAALDGSGGTFILIDDDGITLPDPSGRYYDSATAGLCWGRVVNDGIVATSWQGEYSTGAIQNAINAQSRNGTVRLKKGTYAGSTGITLDGAVRLVGDNQQDTTISYTGTGVAVQVNSDGANTTLNTGLQDLSISTSTGTVGVQIGRTSGANRTGSGAFRDVSISGFSEAGIRLIQIAVGQFVRVTCTANRDGVHFDPSGGNVNTATSFTDCRFHTNTRNGVFMENGIAIRFYGCQFEDNGNEGARLLVPALAADTTIRSVVFDKCYFEDNNNGRGGSGYYQILTANTDTAIVQGLHLDRCYFSGKAAGNGNVYYAKGRFSETYNEYVDVATNVIAVSGSTACYVSVENDRAPSALMGGASNSYVAWKVFGQGNALWGNVGGVMTKLLDLGVSSGGGVAFHGTAAAAQQNITGAKAGNAALTDLLTKLAAIGLVTDSTT